MQNFIKKYKNEEKSDRHTTFALNICLLFCLCQRFGNSNPSCLQHTSQHKKKGKLTLKLVLIKGY